MSFIGFKETEQFYDNRDKMKLLARQAAGYQKAK
jgi:hypothetical protein